MGWDKIEGGGTAEEDSGFCQYFRARSDSLSRQCWNPRGRMDMQVRWWRANEMFLSFCDFLRR